jgi:hypothetical protein
MSDPDLHAVCHDTIDRITAEYTAELHRIYAEAEADARIGLHLRALLGKHRWKTIRREKLQEIVDLHMGVPDGVDR